MQVIFLGTPQFAVPSLERLLDHSDIEVLGVVSQPDKRRGRGNQLIPSPVKKVALEHQLPLWQPKRIKKDTETLAQLQQTQADVFVVVAYGQLLSPEILAMPRLGCVNVHASILPKYRGAAPIQWSLYHGETETGVTTMMIDEGMDSGDMLLKAYTPIHLLDNAENLAVKLAHQGADLLIDTLLKLSQRQIELIPQNHQEATYSPLLKKSDYIIDWTKSAQQIHNQVRGFYPNCFTHLDNKSLKVIATVPLGEEYWPQIPPELEKLLNYWPELSTLSGSPGEVVKLIKNFGPVVQTGTGLLLLLQVQLAGKRIQFGWDFINGTRLAIGDKFHE
jgi:methionyl-tRNA formyltransferase